MAEPAMDPPGEEEHTISGEDDEETQQEESVNLGSNTNHTSLAGLNLAFVLSYLSLSAQERSNLERYPEMEFADQKHQFTQRMSEFANFQNTSRRQRRPKELSAVQRQMSKVEPKIRDCRHCRKF